MTWFQRMKSHSCRIRYSVVGGALVLFATLCPLNSAIAQDAHYWTFQYGPRSSLLGGAVIGSVSDISGVYYNPGALAQAEDLAFAVSTNVFEVSGVRLEDGGGQGVDLGTSRSGIRPSLIAGTISRNLFEGKGVLAYSALTRVRGDQDLAGVFVLDEEALQPSTNLTDLAGLAIYEGQFSDTWGGLTYSHGLGSQFGLGVSWYGAIRSQNRRITTTTEAVEDDSTGAIALDISSGKYSTLRTLAKLGASGVIGPVSAGLTFTTPSLQISGSGERASNSSFTSSDSVFLAVNVQNEIGAEYKTPMSVGFGLGWTIGDGRIHASGEYFDSIDPYRVLEAEPFNAQVPDTSVLTPNPVQSAKEVFNWGLGAEYRFNPALKGYVSYFTDNSFLADDLEQSSLSVLPFDIQTVTLGGEFRVSSVLLTLGGGYGWGSQVDDQLTDILRDENSEFEAKYVYRNFRLLFGFEIGLK